MHYKLCRAPSKSVADCFFLERFGCSTGNWGMVEYPEKTLQLTLIPNETDYSSAEIPLSRRFSGRTAAVSSLMLIFVAPPATNGASWVEIHQVAL
jgi:hypothetical protein